MSSIVIGRGVSYDFANGRQLFGNLSFSFEAKLSALVGPNGVGKTCLARLLAGDLAPTDGVVRRNGAVKLFPQRAEPQSVTVAEFLSAAYEWSLLGEKLLQNIDPQAMCTTLSGGQWMRVRLARALDGQFLVLDEPTNDLDREGRNAVLQFLQHRQGGALVISHDRECLQLCEDIFELSNRGLAKFGGGWSAYVEAKAQERERLRAALDLAKRERDSALAHRVEQRARQERRSRHGAKSAARRGMPAILLGARKRRAQATSGKLDATTLQQAQSAIRAAHEALSELKTDPVMYVDLVGHELPAQKLVAEARAFNVRFNDWIYQEDLDFSWRGNVRVALKGRNGSGKSTLLKVLVGGQFETRGEIRRGELATLYHDQRCSLLDDSKSVLDNVRAVSSASESEIRSGLARFLFAGEAVFQQVSELSGGERLRATLARGFLSTRKPELMVLDEPTNNLDLANVEFLEEIVSAFRGALVVVSHDEEFLENCGVQHVFVVGASKDGAAEQFREPRGSRIVWS